MRSTELGFGQTGGPIRDLGLDLGFCKKVQNKTKTHNQTRNWYLPKEKNQRFKNPDKISEPKLDRKQIEFINSLKLSSFSSSSLASRIKNKKTT